MSSTLISGRRAGKQLAGVVLALLLAASAGCSTRHHDTASTGTALQGADMGGVFGFKRVHPGQRLGVAFPLVKNVSDHPVTIYKLALDHVPGGLRVIGYRAVSLNNRYIVLSREATGAKDDYLRYPNLFASGRVELKPHSMGNLFFAADVLATRRDPGLAYGCEYFYMTADGRKYRQRVRCEYNFGSLAHPHAI